MATINRSVETLFIGDELLLGLRTNAHLSYLGGELARHGLPITRSAELLDRPAEIARAWRNAWERADLVICTGGLGPTKDDLTRETLAAALGRPLHHDRGVEDHLREFFRARGRTPTPNNLRQCQVIEGAEVLSNPHGTAPGQWLEIDGRILVLLPGPPHELKPMVQRHVLPRLIERGWATERDVYLQFRTTGIGESQIAYDFERIFAPYGEALSVAYCAHSGFVDVRLSSPEDRLSWSELEAIAEACKAMLGPGFVGLGKPCIAGLILQKLRELDRTIAVAESCTGGLLASALTDIPGASKVFMGGLIVYRNEAKQNLLGIPDCLLAQHGAVSAECAAAMATGVAERLETDYGLAITGYAGPDGGSEPAGTIYLGYHSPLGVWSSKLVHPGQRLAVKQRAVNAALDFVFRKLQKYAMHELLERLRC